MHGKQSTPRWLQYENYTWERAIWIGIFHLWLGMFCLQFVFLAYGKLAWSFLLEFGLVFAAYGGKSFWSYLRFPPVRKLDLVFFVYGSPTVSYNDEPQVKDLN